MRHLLTRKQWIEIKQTWRAAHDHINMEFIVGGCHNTRPLGMSAGADAPVRRIAPVKASLTPRDTNEVSHFKPTHYLLCS